MSFYFEDSRQWQKPYVGLFKGRCQVSHRLRDKENYCSAKSRYLISPTPQSYLERGEGLVMPAVTIRHYFSLPVTIYCLVRYYTALQCIAFSKDAMGQLGR